MVPQEILNKLAVGSATNEERLFFQQWLDTLDDAELRSVMIEYERILSERFRGEKADLDLLEAIREETYMSAHDSIPVKQSLAPGSRRFAWMGLAALTILTVAGITLLHRAHVGKPLPKSTVAVAKVAEPGGNKATLTLADGTKIDLAGPSTQGWQKKNGVQVAEIDSGLLAYSGKGDGNGFNTLATPRGGQFRLILPDGTHVWLNSVSSLHYPIKFSGPTREVELTGEAYFDVSKNARAPFIVKAGGVEVKVLGTEFNMMAYPDEGATKTTLVNGEVKVTKGAAGSLLTPGQQASIGVNDAAFGLSRPELASVLAWKDGRFRFEETDIKTIMRQLARWYDLDVEYQGEPPVKLFSGVLPRKNQVTEILDALEQTDDVHFKLDGRQLTVIRGKK